MDIGVYEIGQLVRLTALYTNAADRPIDPTAVFVAITKPDSTTDTYSYDPDAGELKRDSLGQYHFDQSVTMSGTWRFRWYSTGSGQAAAHGEFIVEPA
jgi:hypothetical protein